MNNSRFKLLLRNAAILLGAFLLGLLPPLVRTVQLKDELTQTRARLDVAEARDIAAAGYLEVNRNNFGLASRYVSRLFEHLALMSRSGEQTAGSPVAEILAKRDEIGGLLARADPRAKAELQTVVEQLLSPEFESTTRARRR